jgi:hypothetical protein
MSTDLFPGVKRPWHGDNHPHPSSAEVKETVELYLDSLLTFMACPKGDFTLPVPYMKTISRFSFSRNTVLALIKLLVGFLSAGTQYPH